MKKVFLIVATLLIAQVSFACTNIAVTKGASKNGANLVAMTDDANDRDFRVIYVPAKNYEQGSKRPIYKDKMVYPRFNIKDGARFYYLPGEALSEPLGYIDQVSHTYAYFDSIYGLMNEKQLSMAESSCDVKVAQGYKKDERLLQIKDLMRIGLERCTKAKETIKLFDKLTKQYGYYGGGEKLLIADTEEIWVFEIACTPNGNRIWVAKKIPDGNVFVGSNMYAIRDVEKDSPDMMYSDNLFSESENAGWYNPKTDKTFDWLRVVSKNGEYIHSYYSVRRIWRGYDLLAPSKKFSPWVKDAFTRAYPFSVKPDKKVSPQDLMKIMRDYFEGTEFDMTKGVAAGPFGNPNRFPGNHTKVKGDWEHPISLYRCAYSYVMEARSGMPDMIGGVFWLGLNAPYATCYVPFYCGISDLPEAYQIGTNRKLDRNSAWWAYNYVNNLMSIKFSYMIKDVRAMQKKIEGREFALQPFIEKAAIEAYKQSPELAREYLTQYCNSNAITVYKDWWELGDKLIAKYQNGFIVDGRRFSKPGYSEEWFKASGIKPITYEKDSGSVKKDMMTAGGNPEN